MFGADGQYRTKVVLELLDVIHVPLSNRPGGSSTQGELSTQASTSAGPSQYQESQQDLSEEVRLLRVSPSIHFQYLLMF
jgi:hypothetical protein